MIMPQEGFSCPHCHSSHGKEKSSCRGWKPGALGWPCRMYRGQRVWAAVSQRPGKGEKIKAKNVDEECVCVPRQCLMTL